MNFYSIEFWVIALVLTVALLAGFGAFARWCSLGPAVPRKKLEILRVGMTTEEVTGLFGEPRETTRGENGAQYWAYGSRLKRHVLAIEFTPQGRLSKFVHGVPDVRQPGKLRED